MLRLYGIPVAEPDARRLVASLIAEADPDALSAAVIIATGSTGSSRSSPSRPTSGERSSPNS